ncbi:AbrB/MazE/SpoVT family DNA-binding domain-containing protein [Aneurinibacillus migulanus]|uniref:AbrB/MazE/SpoVT family DNA-binding domain-containing protein n=1 Tax=Aneurinibacillus migulanus TaxID=47500 RepID=UPI00399D4763
MHEMGIVRKLDKLGRIVFPIEVRDNLGIKPGDGLEIFVNGEQIILKNTRLDVFSVTLYLGLSNIKEKEFVLLAWKI